MPQIEAKCCLVLLWWMWALELASIKGDTSEGCNSCKCEGKLMVENDTETG